MTQTLDMSSLKTVLLNNPTKETLIEIVSNALVASPALKATVTAVLFTVGQNEINKFAKIAVVAIQYAEQGETDKLNDLCKRVGMPGNIITKILEYARNNVKQ